MLVTNTENCVNIKLISIIGYSNITPFSSNLFAAKPKVVQVKI